MIDPELERSRVKKDLDRFKRRLADPNVDINGLSEDTGTRASVAGRTILINLVRYIEAIGLVRPPQDEIILEMIKEVVNHPKLDINIIDGNGESALDYTYDPRILKILLTHPDLDVNRITYRDNNTYLSLRLFNKNIVKLLLEDGRVDPSVGNQYNIQNLDPTSEVSSLLKNYKYVSPSTYKRMASEVATMSGTDNQSTSNVASSNQQKIPQLPVGISKNITKFLVPKSNTKRGGRKTRRKSRSTKIRSG